MKVVLVNGPPRCGKDTAAKVITAEYHDSIRLGFADHLKRATHAAYGMFDIPFDHFEPMKDEPLEDFFGLTPRRAYIHHSEDYMKPIHGKDVFGRLWFRSAVKANKSLVAVPDSGFVEEAGVILQNIGPENLLLIRVHAEARGKTFDGDSRSYIELPGVMTVDIQNNGHVMDFGHEIRQVVKDFLRGVRRAKGVMA